MTYFDLNMELSEDNRALKEAAHKFAREVMRPTAKELDLMTADEVVAEGSPLWSYLNKAYELGYHKILIPEYYGGLGLSPLQANLVFEEMGWGAFGLSVLTTVFCFPFYMVCVTNDDELIDTFVRPFCDCTDGSVRGCWAITEPDHGSDVIAVGEECFATPRCAATFRPDCTATNG